MAPPGDPRVLVVQPGARRHYAIPAALHQQGILERMDTESFVRDSGLLGKLAPKLSALCPPGIRRMLGRSHSMLSDANVRTSVVQAFQHYRMQRRFRSSAEGLRWYLPHASGRTLKRGFGNANVIYSFVRNVHPKLLEAGQSRGIKVIGDQIIAPSIVEAREAAIQMGRFPGWEPRLALENIASYDALDRGTWEHCDAITCMSDWVRDGLIEAGVHPSKVWMIPYPSNHSHLHGIVRSNRSGPLTVGFVGSVGLRKGAPYFLKVAKELASPELRFVMIGGHGLTRQIITEHEKYVEFTGLIPRAEIAGWLERFDIYYFPSTCEGSAGSVNEAAAAGLGIVTSRNSGSGLSDGEEGFIVPYDDTEAASNRILELVNDPERRIQMGESARARTRKYSIDWYGKELSQSIRRLVNGATQ